MMVLDFTPETVGPWRRSSHSALVRTPGSLLAGGPPCLLLARGHWLDFPHNLATLVQWRGVMCVLLYLVPACCPASLQLSNIVIISDAGDDAGIIETIQLSSSHGATVDLPCRLAPSDDMRWQKEGGSLPDRATQVRTALRIERVRVEDTGKYICTSQGRMQYVHLKVERKYHRTYEE